MHCILLSAVSGKGAAESNRTETGDYGSTARAEAESFLQEIPECQRDSYYSFLAGSRFGDVCGSPYVDGVDRISACRGTRVGVMARYEGTTDIPEHAHLARDTSLNWDLRARGLGGTKWLPLTTCAEENILGYQIDKYHAEDILVHEFAHSIHLIGILTVYPDFNERLKKAYDAALAAGKWKDTYAATNIEEYWAEGVQDWFNVNAEVPKPDGKHNQVNTRKELKAYDRGLYDILSEFFPATNEQISCHKYINKYRK